MQIKINISEGYNVRELQMNKSELVLSDFKSINLISSPNRLN